jgi:hypothetical protein
MATDQVDVFREAEKKAESRSYIDEYTEFMEGFRHKEVSGAEVGEMVARMAGHYMRQNLVMVRSLKVYAKIKADTMGQIDENGKAISASKAEIMAAATPEAYAYEEARAHVHNVQECINSLKSLQKGILNEYAYSNA